MRVRLTATLIKSTVVAALGGLLFGFDTAVISGTTAGLKATFHLSDWGLGLTVAIALVGTILGASLAGIPGDRYGRRDSLRVMAILYLISALGCGLAWSWNALLVFRCIGGLGVGGSSVLGPMYIAEIAPAKWRGRCGPAIRLDSESGSGWRLPAGITNCRPVPLWILPETPAGAGFVRRAARAYHLSLLAAESLARSARSRSCDR
jgi:Sugar (and other) transporter